MRALTDSEARVIAVLLAARPDRERERLRQVRIPRSTYHAVRRRAYEGLWLRDRYIPHPVPLGFPFVTFLLARPFADRFEDFARVAAADPGNVVLLTGRQVALAIFFHKSEGEGRRWAVRMSDQNLGGAPTACTVGAEGPTVPVYFDFEGLWCHLAGIAGTLAYPHGLGGRLPTAEREGESPSLTSHRAWAIGELLRRPFLGPEAGKGPHLVGPFGLPFAQRRMLARGWVDHRTLLDPGPLPAYQGKSPDQVVLINGAPRPGAKPDELFGELTRECRVFPFLFVVGTDRWLLGAWGASTPPPPDPTAPRRPVLGTLREYLEGIDVVQEPASQFTTRVDHRYDRVLPLRDGSTGSKV
ncbi:MAG: hypothetical protein L3K02_09660 [Thermoplasmata archaeon]|nr:hypothetical protein [Thermoplasmata archaeon]